MNKISAYTKKKESVYKRIFLCVNELPTNNKLGKGRNIVVEKVNKGKGFVLHLNLPYLHAGINIWIRLDIFLLFSFGQFR